MKKTLQVTVNGASHEEEIDTRMPLVDFLRDRLRLTGTHIGCRTGNCGACTVVVNGDTMKSCCILAADADGSVIETVEALSQDVEELHPVQKAFVENQGLQCGFCTPGMVLTTIKFLESNPNPTEDEIRHGISGNLCRCTGYQFIVKSIMAAAQDASQPTP